MDKLVKIESTELDKVVTNSGLAIEEGESIKQSYIPFIVQLSEIHAQSSKIDFENPQSIDETIARELRLKTVKIRTGASDLKDDRKRIFLLKGNLEQAAYKLIEASCKLTEETLVNVEKAREIAEKKLKEERKLKRIEILTALEYDFTFVDILNMPDEHFDKLVLQLENERDQKIEAEKQAEIKRLEEIRLNNLETQRRFAAYEYKQFWTIEYNFRNFTNSDFETLMLELKLSKENYDKKQAEIAAENEKLRKVNEEKELQLKKEREKAANEKRISDEKARIEKQKADEAIRKANEEKAELQRKIDEKKKADEKAKKDAELKAENEAKEKAELERKASIAPDKEKLTIWLNSINLDKFATENIGTGSVKVANDIMSKLEAFKNWALKQVETL